MKHLKYDQNFTSDKIFHSKPISLDELLITNNMVMHKGFAFDKNQTHFEPNQIVTLAQIICKESPNLSFHSNCLYIYTYNLILIGKKCEDKR